jgi:hypothetical protein
LTDRHGYRDERDSHELVDRAGGHPGHDRGEDEAADLREGQAQREPAPPTGTAPTTTTSAGGAPSLSKSGTKSASEA